MGFLLSDQFVFTLGQVMSRGKRLAFEGGCGQALTEGKRELMCKEDFKDGWRHGLTPDDHAKLLQKQTKLRP